MSAPPSHRPRLSLLPEASRQLVALLVGVVVGLVCAPLWSAVAGESIPGMQRAAVGLGAFVVAYAIVTHLAFRWASPARLRAWAQSARRVTWVQRWVLGALPGSNFATAVSIIALALTFAWLPKLEAPTSLQTTVPLVGALLVVAGAWATLAVTYAVDYLVRDLADEPALAFPGEAQRTWLDYLYFSLSVSASLGPGDVQVLSTDFRRVVSGHVVLAFLFNAVIVAAAVALAIAV